MQIRNTLRHIASAAALAALMVGQAQASDDSNSSGSYQDLVSLFAQWRAFEVPPNRGGAPDYTAATTARRQAELKEYQQRLASINPGSWPVEQRVDYEIVRAEMNGMDFNLRVLQPWVRDPAWYKTLWTEQSDTPAHEGPTNHATVELWTYSFPLSKQAEAGLARGLAVIPPLCEQARGNLTGNAHDLWVTGAGTLRTQVADLDALAEKTGKNGRVLKKAIADARAATESLIDWLDAEAPSKTGPSGIGRENYSWYLRNVVLVPMDWQDEVDLLKRELARAHASLRLEEARNAGLPELTAVATPEEYQQRANDEITRYIDFLRSKDLYPMRDSMDPAMRAQVGQFVPIEKRNFFSIASHIEPLALFTHFYHWWDLARMRDEPHASPIRRGPLLYNIWNNRAEGMATAMEEFMLHAGLYDLRPRAREVVWIMLAQRAARGLASLYAHDNQFDLQQAKAFQVEWTPRGWMRPDLDLLGFEQQLYLRQPGYGSSYVTGKYLLEDLMRVRSHQLGKDFSMKRYFDEVNGAGMIPVTLIQWQLTGTRPQ